MSEWAFFCLQQRWNKHTSEETKGFHPHLHCTNRLSRHSSINMGPECITQLTYNYIFPCHCISTCFLFIRSVLWFIFQYSTNVNVPTISLFFFGFSIFIRTQHLSFNRKNFIRIPCLHVFIHCLNLQCLFRPFRFSISYTWIRFFF